MTKTSHPAHPEAEEAPEAGVAPSHWSQEVGWHILKISPAASGRADETAVGDCLRRFIRGGSDRGQLISVERSCVEQLEGSSLLEWSGHPLDGDDAVLQVAGIAVSGFTFKDAIAWITHCLFRQVPEDNVVRINTAPIKGNPMWGFSPLSFKNLSNIHQTSIKHPSNIPQGSRAWPLPFEMEVNCVVVCHSHWHLHASNRINDWISY